MTRPTGGGPLEVLTLELEGELFALEAVLVREILDLVPVTEVPHSQAFVNGLINVRGRVVPLADLRVRLGMAQKPPTVDTRIVVVELEIDDEPVIAAIRADKVHEVTEVAASQLQETPRLGLQWRAEFISCLGKRGDDIIVVLDIARVLAGATQPGATQPGAVPSGITQPGTAPSGITKSGMTQVGMTQVGMAPAGMTQPGEPRATRQRAVG